MDVIYIMKGSVINNTDKILTNAEISGELQVIFKDKALKSSNDRDSGFKRKVTQSNPWKPQEEIDFYIRSEEHTSELQSRGHLVCRLLLEKKKVYIILQY